MAHKGSTYHCSKNKNGVNPLREAWVDLLSRYEWSWFTTLTFRDLPKTYTAVNRTKKWLTAIKKQEKRRIPYFMCMEWTRLQNRPHMHLLMGGLHEVNRSKWWLTWFTWYGAARILPYDSRLGAAYYLTKYVVKDIYQKGIFEIKGLQGASQLILDLKK